MQARVVECAGEKFFALFDGDVLDDVWKFTVEDGYWLELIAIIVARMFWRRLRRVLGRSGMGMGIGLSRGQLTFNDPCRHIKIFFFDLSI